MIEGVENAYPNYGVPQQKKFPMPDKKHILSAIKFFNYVEPKYEKQLAEAIMRKIDEYGMDDVNVGPDNRFLKYWMKQGNELQHHGIIGMKWGIRRYQNEDGTLTAAGRKRYGDQIGWEAKQMYKRGTISKDEYRKRIQPMTKRAKIDNYELLGQGRKLREGIERNKRGIRAASIPVGAFVGATTFAKLQKMMHVKPGTKEAVASILLGAIGGMTLGAINTETELLNNRSRLSDYDYKSPYKKRTSSSKMNLKKGAAIGIGAVAGLAALPGAASVLTKAPHIIPENSLPKLVVKGEALVQGLGLIDIK